MITVPGDITSETAGPLLRRGAPVRNRSWRDERADVTTGDPYPYTELRTTELVCATAEDPGGVSLTLLVLDLSDDLGMDIAARWLARHLGNWQPWEITRAVQGDYATLAAIYRQLGLPDPGRWEPHPDPAAALRLAILAAAGRTE